MKYVAYIDPDKFKDFKFFEDADGKYLVAKDANAKDNEWIALHFTEVKKEKTNGRTCKS